MYRWFLAFYFLSWLIVSGVKSEEGPRYLVFLTHWGFITLNTYLLIAALSSTTKYLSMHLLCPTREYDLRRRSEYSFSKPEGCCGHSNNKLSWYQMLHWIFFLLANELAVTIMILYWSLLYRGGAVDGINANVHLMNGLVALLDLWVSGVPINFLHVIYPMIFGAVYGLFSGIYYAITEDVIYQRVLDYGEHLGTAVGVVLGVVLVFIPLMHCVIFYLQHQVKFWIFYWCFARSQDESSGETDPMSVHMEYSTTSSDDGRKELIAKPV